MTTNGFLKGVWQFCSYLFWPQRRPMGQWHTVHALEEGSVLYESTNGEYLPLEPEEIWTPENI